MPKDVTINDGVRLIKKIEACKGMAAKLILLRQFGDRYAAYWHRETMEPDKCPQCGVTKPWTALPPCHDTAHPWHRKTMEIDREEDGRYIAEFPEVPGAMAYGSTPEEAEAKARRIMEHVKGINWQLMHQLLIAEIRRVTESQLFLPDYNKWMLDELNRMNVIAVKEAEKQS